ncbi:MAG: hypothetical protein WC895_05355 [Candidatus Shapirobacteria bacterium]|jgi:hypothetical protein
MLFLERKNDLGFSYDVEDVFGKIHIESKLQLTGEILDDMVSLLIRQNLPAETITGEVKHGENVVAYTFTREPVWKDGDEEETKICGTSSYTSTPGTGSGFTPKSRFMRNIFNWLRKFADLFRRGS